MNDDGTFEHEIRAILDEKAPMLAPNHLLHTFEFNARRARRYPRWLVFIKEPTMRSDSQLAVGSPTARAAVVIVATLLLAIAVAAAGVAGQRLIAADGAIVVDASGDGDFITITEAVAAAEDGDEVLVMPGTYTESFIIERDITLRGEDRDSVVITAPDDGPTEIIFEDVFEGDEPEYDPYAILLRDTNATLRDLTFRGQGSEVFASGGSPTLEGLLFDSTGFPFRGTGGAAGSSIVITGGSSARVLGNELVAGGPIGVFDESEPLVEGNHLSGGPHIWGVRIGDGTIFRGNTVEEPFMWAFGLIDDDAPTVVENTIVRPGQSGIEIWGGQPTVVGNTIEEPGTTGINVEGSEDYVGTAPHIEGNTITDASLFAISVRDAEATVLDNIITGGGGVLWAAPFGSIEGNSMRDGQAGLVVMSGAPIVADNDVEAMEARGIVVGKGASPSLSGNRSCDNGENIFLADGSAPSHDGTNDFCESVEGE